MSKFNKSLVELSLKEYVDTTLNRIKKRIYKKGDPKITLNSEVTDIEVLVTGVLQLQTKYYLDKVTKEQITSWADDLDSLLRSKKSSSMSLSLEISFQKNEEDNTYSATIKEFAGYLDQTFSLGLEEIKDTKYSSLLEKISEHLTEEVVPDFSS